MASQIEAHTNLFSAGSAFSGKKSWICMGFKCGNPGFWEAITHCTSYLKSIHMASNGYKGLLLS